MQEYQPGRSFDMVISRAVASLDELYQQTVHLLRPGGRMLFMKGAVPEQEISALQDGCAGLHIERLNIPGLAAERHLLWLETTGESSTTA
jgi:16S rRNA (guanine527-N7)-methyltransferase